MTSEVTPAYAIVQATVRALSGVAGCPDKIAAIAAAAALRQAADQGRVAFLCIQDCGQLRRWAGQIQTDVEERL